MIRPLPSQFIVTGKTLHTICNSLGTLKKIYLFLLLFTAGSAGAQDPVTDSTKWRVIAANPSLMERSKSWQKLWGTNRRVEWATPIKVPVLWLDSIDGGLIPYQSGGGGNETKSFRLKSKEGKEYSLRSVNKSREEVIEDRFKKSFVEDLINDGVSSSYPYGAFPLTIMQEKAGIYHTIPHLYYLPKQAALDTFNNKYGDDLYMLEQRPDGDWSDADNLGNFKSFSSTEKLIEKLQEDNDNRADQYAFIKARLFDMMIADWDRHEDNFRWGKRDVEDKNIYSPIPRDRDQAFYTHNGVLLDRFLPLAGFSFMQHFDHTYGNINSFNLQERYFDRFFSNEMELNDWISAAKDLQQALTDDVIAQSVQQLPPEIYAVSGNELLEKIKSRRDQLIPVATTYYLFLAKEVDIIGSKKKDRFEITSNDTGAVKVIIHKISKKGKKDTVPFYERVFNPSETREIRVHGLSDEDIYSINSTSPITIRLIGGASRDSFTHTGNRVHIYDNSDNVFQTNSARLHLSRDSTIHAYNYKNFEYDSKGFQPLVGFDLDDRIYVGIGWSTKKYKWRRAPYAYRHNIGINYSLSQKGISVSLASLWPRLIAGWDLMLQGKYDAVNWKNFAGPGNETTWLELFDDYYQLRSREWMGQLGLRRTFGKSSLEFNAQFRQITNRNDKGRYAMAVFTAADPKLLEENNYGGLGWKYKFASVNDEVVPTKGFSFLASGSYMNNFSRDEFFQNYISKLQAWLPLSKKFSICIRAGGSTIVGPASVLNNALSVQHAIVGGFDDLRGYTLQRFWGRSAFYNNNELRFITNMRTYLLNATIGLIAFFDDGRVWMPNEDSDLMHTSYGGGLLLAPFHFASFTLTYGISDEMKLFQLRFNSLF